MADTSIRPDETKAEIFSEHTWIQGAFLGSVAYGMATILFMVSVRLLWIARKGGNKTRNLGLMVYIIIIFILSTLYTAGLLEFTQESFIDGRNIEGGPNAYESVMYSIPIDMLANVTLVILAWMCDIINVWRCYVIYLGARIPSYVVLAIPGLMYLSTMVMGILWLKQVAAPAASPWDALGVNWTIPYFIMSLALNLLVTILIVARLLVCRAKINKVLGKKHGAQYTSLAAMIVESASIYSTFSLLFLVPFAINTPTSLALSQLFLQALSPVQVVSTLLIIFRVAQGKSWSAQTSTAITGGSGESRTIGGSSRNNAIRVQTDTATYNDTGKESITLQSLDKSRKLNFNELESRNGDV
ncbi:hypothetical protein C8J57DRAFT_1095158 [Mycena rebaudengoi]|nr:hypothetical protein C8J57DRAFT_1095158 [Mycena rebaudengoi]